MEGLSTEGHLSSVPSPTGSDDSVGTTISVASSIFGELTGWIKEGEDKIAKHINKTHQGDHGLSCECCASFQSYFKKFRGAIKQKETDRKRKTSRRGDETEAEQKV